MEGLSIAIWVAKIAETFKSIDVQKSPKNMGSEERRSEEGRSQRKPTDSRPPCLSGLPLASRILTADVEKTSTIFKSFHETSIRNLLFLEARVVALEDVQIHLDREDTKIYGAEIEMKEVAASWEQFALLASPRQSSWGRKIPDCALRRWQEQRNNWPPVPSARIPNPATKPESQGLDNTQSERPASKEGGGEPGEIKKEAETERLENQEAGTKLQETVTTLERKDPEKASAKPDIQDEEIIRPASRKEK